MFVEILVLHFMKNYKDLLLLYPVLFSAKSVEFLSLISSQNHSVISDLIFPFLAHHREVHNREQKTFTYQK